MFCIVGFVLIVIEPKSLRHSQTLNYLFVQEVHELEQIEQNTREFLSTLVKPEQTSEEAEEKEKFPQVTRNRSRAICIPNSLPIINATPMRSTFSTISRTKGSPRVPETQKPQNSRPVPPSPIPKRLRTNSIINSNSIFQARRISVTARKHSASSTDEFLDHADSSTLGFDISKSSDDMGIDKVKAKLDKALENKWETELFRRFLRQHHIDQVLDFYLAIKALPEKLESIIQAPEFTGNAKNELLQLSLSICSRFEYTLPRGLKTIISTIISPMLLIHSNITLNISCKRVSTSSSEDEQSMEYEACEEYFDSDSEHEEFHVDPLTDETMELLDIGDKYFCQRTKFAYVSPLHHDND